MFFFEPPPPTGRNFIPPPSFIRPLPPVEYFQGWVEGGCIKFRDGETTIKIKFALLRGVGLVGREENRPKTLFFFFMGNARTIKN